MAIKKKFIHFNSFDTFNSKKLSANTLNTSYTVGTSSEVVEGEPDVKFGTIVFIKSTGQIWTHGRFYSLSDKEISDINKLIEDNKKSSDKSVEDLNKLIEDLTSNLDNKVDKVSGSSLIQDTKVTSYDLHLSSTNNPHSVTKDQVGLGNVDNTSDSDKPISTATQSALDNINKTISDNKTSTDKSINDLNTNKVDKVSGSSLVPDTKITSYDSHLSNTSNPHFVTKSQVGLGNVDNTSDLDKPISTATQSALDEINKTIEEDGLVKTEAITDINSRISNIDNTSDSDKPISTATQEALDKINDTINSDSETIAKTLYTLNEKTDESFEVIAHSLNEINDKTSTLETKTSTLETKTSTLETKTSTLETKTSTLETKTLSLDLISKMSYISYSFVTAKGETEAGDIAYFSSYKDDTLLFCSGSDWVSGLGTPVGVVVIPSSHREDGKTVIMSLSNMSLKTPETGSLSASAVSGDNYMMWGDYQKDLSLTNYTKVPIIDPSTGTSSGTNGYGYFQSDIYGVPSSYVMPSPYNEDGTKNTGYSVSGTSLYDMDGKSNQSTIMSAVTADISGTISNSSSTGSYPAASCCSRYYTTGTSAGDWYLPSIGELGYLMNKLNTINSSLSTLGSGYAVKVGDKDTYSTLGSWLWSSTEYSSTSAWNLYTNNGNCTNYNKYSYGTSYRVRAFCAL